MTEDEKHKLLREFFVWIESNDKVGIMICRCKRVGADVKTTERTSEDANEEAFYKKAIGDPSATPALEYAIVYFPDADNSKSYFGFVEPTDESFGVYEVIELFDGVKSFRKLKGDELS